jgi:hypothetical protein
MHGVHLLGSCLAIVVSGALTWPSQARAQSASLAPEADAPVPPGESVPPSPSGAPGQPPAAPPAPLADTLQGQAKADYEAARLLFDGGDYSRALLMFQSAYQAASDPRLLWNEAACERSLRHYVKASSLVRQFLATRSPLITPDTARRAQAFLDAAVPLTAPLEVVSNEPNADVYLDDELLGTPGLASQARVDLGTHRVVLKRRGFQTYTEMLNVANSSTVHVTAILQPIPVKAPVFPHDAAPSTSGAFRLPTWAWIASGSIVLAGIATASYFVFKPSSGPEPVPGSIGSAVRF